MVFAIILLVLRRGDVGSGGNPIPQPSYNFFKRLCLVGVVDTRLDKKKLWKITVAPLIVSVLVGTIISDRLGDKWLEGHGKGGYYAVVGGEGCGECKMTVSGCHYPIMESRRWGWGFFKMLPSMS